MVEIFSGDCGNPDGGVLPLRKRRELWRERKALLGNPPLGRQRGAGPAEAVPQDMRNQGTMSKHQRCRTIGGDGDSAAHRHRDLGCHSEGVDGILWTLEATGEI